MLIEIAPNLTLEQAPEDSPLMGPDDFKAITARTCGEMGCSAYKKAN